ncbi:MAG: hypothetical protein BRD49_04925, partial [Bacteroidetes bacterium SW_10_40_5]
DIAVNPNNPKKIFIATGTEVMEKSYGYGLLKSTDHGKTWQNTGLYRAPSQQQITHRVVINPKRLRTIFALVEDSLYRSYNGGSTFEFLMEASEETANWKPVQMPQMVMHPKDTSVLYCASYDFHADEGGAQIWKSKDGGNTWQDITPEVKPTSDKFYLEVSPSTPDKLYVRYRKYGESNQNHFRVYHHSTNEWNQAHSVSMSTGRFYGPMEVSPNDASQVYGAQVDLWRSCDNGKSFVKRGCHGFQYPQYQKLHVDVRALQVQAYLSDNKDRVFVGNDGGIAKSYNGGKTWQNLNGPGLFITQFFGIGNSDLNPDLLVGGTQDNNVFVKNGFTDHFVQKTGGDGGDCIVNPQDPDHVYCQNWSGPDGGFVTMTSNGGQQWQYLRGQAMPPDPQYQVRRPLRFHQNTGRFYVGHSEVFKSNSYPSDTNYKQLSHLEDTFRFNRNLNILAIAPSDTNVIFIGNHSTTWGKDKPRLFRTTDHGKTWDNITQNLRAIHCRRMSQLLIHPDSSNHLWITFNDFSNSQGQAKVFYSKDGGQSFHDFSTGLPDFPANAIAFHNKREGVLYLGTDAGVYYRLQAMKGWKCYNRGLPPAMVLDLEINNQAGKLRAATFGRGIWQVDLKAH